jgi:hypothetical protein
MKFSLLIVADNSAAWGMPAFIQPGESSRLGDQISLKILQA